MTKENKKTITEEADQIMASDVEKPIKEPLVECKEDAEMAETNQSKEEPFINHNVEVRDEKVTKFKTHVKVYEEIITYGEYLEEQRELRKDKIVIDLQAKESKNENMNEPEETPKPPEAAKISHPKNGATENPKDTQLRSISYKNTETLTKLIISPMQRASELEEIVKNFKIIIPKVVSKPAEFVPTTIYTKHQKEQAYERFLHQKLMQHKNVNQSLKYSNILFFPHRNLIQYDCGKL